jgi:hypothetical protein
MNGDMSVLDHESEREWTNVESVADKAISVMHGCRVLRRATLSQNVALAARAVASSRKIHTRSRKYHVS